MSEQDPIQDDDEDVLAAEYALGVLDGWERRSVERRMLRDPGFMRRIEAWQGHFAPMFADFPAVQPSTDLFAKVAADLDRIVRGAPLAAAVTSVDMPADRWRGVSVVWRWLAIAASGVAVASLAALFIATRPLAPEAQLAAEMAGSDGGPVLYTAVVDRGTASAVLVPVAIGAAAPGHSHELWLIAPGEAPRSLGVIDAKRLIRIEIDPALLGNGRVLAITLEQSGGSPTGQPLGPLVAKGELLAM